MRAGVGGRGHGSVAGRNAPLLLRVASAQHLLGQGTGLSPMPSVPAHRFEIKVGSFVGALLGVCLPACWGPDWGDQDPQGPPPRRFPS